MFKCKSCGRQFGANTPQTCPACGAKNPQPEQSTRGLMILFGLDAIGTLIVLIVMGLIVAGVAKLASHAF